MNEYEHMFHSIVETIYIPLFQLILLYIHMFPEIVEANFLLSHLLLDIWLYAYTLWAFEAIYVFSVPMCRSKLLWAMALHIFVTQPCSFVHFEIYYRLWIYKLFALLCLTICDLLNFIVGKAVHSSVHCSHSEWHFDNSISGIVLCILIIYLMIIFMGFSSFLHR